MPTAPSASVRTNSYGITPSLPGQSLARRPAWDRASRGPDRRYRVVNRLALVFAPVVTLLLLPLAALAEDQPFKTVVDSMVPKTAGLSIVGTTGGCDLLVQNQTGQDVILLDMSKPAKPLKFAARAKGAAAKPPVPVHLPTPGAWPSGLRASAACSSPSPT